MREQAKQDNIAVESSCETLKEGKSSPKPKGETEAQEKTMLWWLSCSYGVRSTEYIISFCAKLIDSLGTGCELARYYRSQLQHAIIIVPTALDLALKRRDHT